MTSSLRIAASTVRAWRWLGAEQARRRHRLRRLRLDPGRLWRPSLRRVPLVLHEQNSVPGLANRVLSRWAVGRRVTYEESAAPLRASRPGRGHRQPGASRRARRRPRRGAVAPLGLPADAPVLLVFGGSRGARHLNTALVGTARPAAGDRRPPRRSRGRQARGVERSRGAVQGRRRRWWPLAGARVPRRHGFGARRADLVVARAGATSIAEITALGRPSVLVPYPVRDRRPPDPERAGAGRARGGRGRSPTPISTGNGSATRSSGCSATRKRVLPCLPRRARSAGPMRPRASPSSHGASRVVARAHEPLDRLLGGHPCLNRSTRTSSAPAAPA